MILETTRALIQLFKNEINKNTVLSSGTITELSKLPYIILHGPTPTEKLRMMRDPERIDAYDYENNIAVEEVPPRWYDLRFGVTLATDSSLKLLELMEECSRLQQRAKLLTAKPEEGKEGRTRRYLWRWEKLPSVHSVPNVSQVYEAYGDLVVYDVEVYSGIQKVVPLITSVHIHGEAVKEFPEGVE